MQAGINLWWNFSILSMVEMAEEMWRGCLGCGVEYFQIWDLVSSSSPRNAEAALASQPAPAEQSLWLQVCGGRGGE